MTVEEHHKLVLFSNPNVFEYLTSEQLNIKTG